MEALATATLVAATVSSGLLAGVFLLYAHTVMPALRGADDESFVTTFALLDRAIVNPWFLLTGFLGAPVLTAAAVALHLGEPAFGWAVAALALHLLMVLETARVHLPRNDALKVASAAGSPAGPAREAFDELRWARWNLLRVAASSAALVLLAVALAR